MTKTIGVFFLFTTLDPSLVRELPSKEGGEGEEQQAQVSGGEFGERSAKIREESGGNQRTASANKGGRTVWASFLMEGQKTLLRRPPSLPKGHDS